YRPAARPVGPACRAGPWGAPGPVRQTGPTPTATTGRLLVPAGHLDVVAEQDPLVAQVEAAVGDDGVRPGLGLAPVRLVEAALLAAALRRCLHQRHLPVLAADVQPVVGVAERPLAHRAVLPADLAGAEVQAQQRAVARAVHEVVDKHHAADAVGHLLR